MKGDFCRMCGSKKLKRQKRDIFLASQNKKIKAVSIWICQNCGEEFLDDSSRERLYSASRVARRRRAVAA
jgi:YgiT-type zinc finger domain-containing protein